MGYYPLGSKFFTNLTHYVRTGDFVRNLLHEARNRNEYAFALGALAHYAADNVGHPEGTNQIMPTVYPDLRAKFGPVSHLRASPQAPHRAGVFVRCGAGGGRPLPHPGLPQGHGFPGEQGGAGAGLSANVWAGAGPGGVERRREHGHLSLCREPVAAGHGRAGRLAQPAQGNP